LSLKRSASTDHEASITRGLNLEQSRAGDYIVQDVLKCFSSVIEEVKEILCVYTVDMDSEACFSQGIKYVKQAVAADNAGEYATALPLYMNALEHWKICLEDEENPELKEAVSSKFTEYLQRAEAIRGMLDEEAKTKKTKGKKRTRDINVDVLLQRSAEYARQAVAADNAGEYATALPLYMNALDHLKICLKDEEMNPEFKEAVSGRFSEYLQRAETIGCMLDKEAKRRSLRAKRERLKFETSLEATSFVKGFR
jgi:tetratricopeptide (TPR) repeat protein